MRTLALLAAAIWAAPALAQIPPPRETPPAAVDAAPRNVVDSGQTKPPGAAEGPGSGTRPDLEAKSREIGRKIDTGICRGCD